MDRIITCLSERRSRLKHFVCWIRNFTNLSPNVLLPLWQQEVQDVGFVQCGVDRAGMAGRTDDQQELDIEILTRTRMLCRTNTY